jgi:uncharacterized membrane protein
MRRCRDKKAQRSDAALATAVLSAIAVVAVSSPAQAAAPFYNVRNRANWKCIDAKTQDPHAVQLWSCSGASEQIWDSEFDYDYPEDPAGTGYHGFFTFFNKRYGGCLAVSGTVVYHEGSTFLCDPYGPNAMRWHVFYTFNDGHWYQVWRNGMLDSSGHALCLTLNNNSSANGTRLSVSSCDKNSAAQRRGFTDT